MPIVHVPWDEQLVILWRQVCREAVWDSEQCAWDMTQEEAFLDPAPARMFFRRSSCTFAVDETVWVVGHKPGAPYRLCAHD